MTNEQNAPTEPEVLVYLNILRESGVTNMYRAAPYLELDMGLSPKEARAYALRYISSSVQGEFAPPRAARAAIKNAEGR